MQIIVTGGAGYIGSHTCLELLNGGHQVIVIDNLCNSNEESLRRVEKLTGKTLRFFKADLLDIDALDRIFDLCDDIGAVMHFAGLKAVGESMTEPLLYYRNNIVGTLNLCQVMQKYGVKNIVFSSSATVYGDPGVVPFRETFVPEAVNPYGRTKLAIENLLKDLHSANPEWNVSILRYFNPVGAHESGEIGEDPNGIPNNLMPYIAQVAVGRLSRLSVYGNDYETPDGTCIRDYIHVVDLAAGHLKALEKLFTNPGIIVHNLGTGKGQSVLEMISAFAKASGKQINYTITDRRSGDIGCFYADPTLAREELGWKAVRGIDQMCRDAWNWQSKNPNGYR